MSLILTVSSIATSCGAEEVINDRDEVTFETLIKSDGQDPFVIKAGEYYYYCEQKNGNSVVLIKSNSLQDISLGESHTVYTSPSETAYSSELWAPEIHFLRGNWYIYFAADDGANENHRMYVAKGGTNANDPLDGVYTFVGPVSDITNRWAIDGTAFEYNNQLYFVWSGWEGSENIKQDLYIAEMSDPVTISSERVCISTPTYEWEKKGNPWVNEGPEVLIKNNTVHIIYSASGSWTNDYCLARLTNTTGDFLNPSAWTKVGPVFEKNSLVYGPGHACFVKNENGEDFIVYHAAKAANLGWNRNVRMQRFVWHDDIPFFGTPLGANILQPIEVEKIEFSLEKTYRIINAQSGKAILADKPQENGLLKTSLNESTDWKIVSSGNGFYTITIANTNLSMTNIGKTKVGEKFILKNASNDPCQTFRIQYIGNGEYKIINIKSLLALTENDFVTQQRETNVENQRWYFQEN